MARGDAGPLPRLGRKGRSLGQLRPVRAGPRAATLDRLAVHTAGIGTGQADTTPEVGLPCDGEVGDRGGDPSDVGPFDEPEAPAESLVEDPQRIARKPARSRSSTDRRGWK